MEILLIGLATGFNFVIILWKFKAGRIEDACIDGVILTILAWLFSGTMTGLAIGMVASCIISVYLLISPPKFITGEEE